MARLENFMKFYIYHVSEMVLPRKIKEKIIFAFFLIMSLCAWNHSTIYDYKKLGQFLAKNTSIATQNKFKRLPSKIRIFMSNNIIAQYFFVSVPKPFLLKTIKSNLSINT